MPFRSTLPPREEHITLVIGALTASGPLAERELIRATGLTQTQVRSALEALISRRSVARERASAGGGGHIRLLLE